jgi:hypothetical protein
VKFVVKRVEPSPGRPAGIEYSLTLHDRSNRRVVGFDNAHPLRSRRDDARYDHRHLAGRIVPYTYQSVAKLIEDFWRAVDNALQG